MNLVLTPVLDMVKMYDHTKNEVSMLRHSKVRARTDTQTGRPTDTHTFHDRYRNRSVGTDLYAHTLMTRPWLEEVTRVLPFLSTIRSIAKV